jgi:L-malate glycosyltransferase
MTICQVLHSLGIGGAEVLAARLARQLRDRYRFLFVCLDELGTLGEELREEGFSVCVLDRQPGLNLRCARKLAEIVRHERVDLLHAHQYTPFFYSATSRLPGSQPPVLFTEHGRSYPDYPRWKRILANRVLLRKQDRVVAVGEAVRQALIYNEGIAPGRVDVIYNGIPLERFDLRLTGTERAAIRAQIGLEPHDLVLIQVARLDYLKDHATAIRTLERLIGRHVNPRLVLVGEGPERGTVQNMVRQRGLETYVRLLGLRTDVPRLLMASDIAVLSSISEGIPLSLIEAMAAGLPVVSTRVGGVPEVVADGQVGLLSPAGDEHALAENVLRLASSPDLRAQMGRQGRDLALALFSEGRMQDAYQRLYQNMGALHPTRTAHSPGAP